MNPKVFSRFQSVLGPRSVALWWVTPKDLNINTDYLSELDYFFDGLIIKSLRGSSNQNLENLFLVHHHFGNPFYLIYSHESKAQAYLKQTLNLIQPQNEQQYIHPLAVSPAILKSSKNDVEKLGLKIAPLIDGMSS